MVKNIIVFLREMSKKCYFPYYSSGLSEAEIKEGNMTYTDKAVKLADSLSSENMTLFCEKPILQ